MKSVKLGFLILLLFGSIQVGLSQSKTSPSKFTISRECDGGLCHFEIISFNYGRSSSVAVGIGDSTLTYYFSVQITNGKVSKDYIYSDEPDKHFVEKENGQRVEPTLNKLLLDVYKLGNYLIDNEIAIRNRTFSETGRFLVLANLRNYINSLNRVTTKPQKVIS